MEQEALSTLTVISDGRTDGLSNLKRSLRVHLKSDLAAEAAWKARASRQALNSIVRRRLREAQEYSAPFISILIGWKLRGVHRSFDGEKPQLKLRSSRGRIMIMAVRFLFILFFDYCCICISMKSQ